MAQGLQQRHIPTLCISGERQTLSALVRFGGKISSAFAMWSPVAATGENRGKNVHNSSNVALGLIISQLLICKMTGVFQNVMLGKRI